MTETVKLHADRSASASERWANCPASSRLIESLPFQPPASIHAARGSAMHLCGELWLKTGNEPDWSVPSFGGNVLDDDEIEAVRFYVEFIGQELVLCGGTLLVEQSFDLDQLRPGMFGTNDSSLVGCPDKILRIYDFKGGRGVPVEAVGNSQMLYYGFGALLKYLGQHEYLAVEVVVVQPRCPHPDGPVRRWQIDLIDIYDWAQKLGEAYDRTYAADAPLIAGDWCRWCPAKGVCPAYKDYGSKMIGLDFSPINPLPLPVPQQITPAELGAMLPRLDIAEAWINAVRDHAHAAAEQGYDIPGHKLVQKRARRAWREEDQAKLIEELHGLGISRNDCVTASVKSPAQIEKYLKKDHRHELSPLVENKSSGTTLVTEDDPRPAIGGMGALGFKPLPETRP